MKPITGNRFIRLLAALLLLIQVAVAQPYAYQTSLGKGQTTPSSTGTSAGDVCGTSKHQSGIIVVEMSSLLGDRLSVSIKKADGTAFSQPGTAYIKVDGVCGTTIAEQAYQAGQKAVGLSVKLTFSTGSRSLYGTTISTARSWASPFVVTTSPVRMPVVTAPTPGQPFPSTTQSVVLQWNANGNIAGTHYYVKAVDITSNQTLQPYLDLGEMTNYTVRNLQPGHSCRFVVGAVLIRDGVAVFGDVNAETAPQTFSVGGVAANLETPVLSYPTNNKVFPSSFVSTNATTSLSFFRANPGITGKNYNLKMWEKGGALIVNKDLGSLDSEPADLVNIANISVMAGKTYEWQVSVSAPGAITKQSEKWTFSIQAPATVTLNTPTLTYPGNGESLAQMPSVSLSWRKNNETGSATYAVEIVNNATGTVLGDWNYKSVGDQAYAFVTGIQPGQTYRWIVQAVRAGSTSVKSGAFTFKVGGIAPPTPPPVAALVAPTPTAPTNALILPAGTTSTTLRWNKNNTDGVATYAVRLVDLTTNTTIWDYANKSNVNETVVQNLQNGHTYRWVVRVERSGSTNAESGVYTFSVAESAPVVCLFPANLTVSNVKISSFVASGNSVAGANGYEFQVKNANGQILSTQSVTQPTNSVALVNTTFTGLTQGTAYSVLVRTKCGNSYSDWSGAVQVTLPKSWVPSAYKETLSKPGVKLYKHSSQNSYVQVVDLSRGGSVKFLYGDKELWVSKDGVFGEDNFYFYRESIQNHWKDFKKNNASAFSVVNGAYFKSYTEPTALSFPLVDEKLISTGAEREKIGQGNTFKLSIFKTDNKTATIECFYECLNKKMPYLSNNQSYFPPLQIVGYDKTAQVQRDESQGRTYLGVADYDGKDGNEIILILTAESLTADESQKVLEGFGASEMIILDGGGSTKFMGYDENKGDKEYILGKYYSINKEFIVDRWREIPHAIGVKSGNNSSAREAASEPIEAEPSFSVYPNPSNDGQISLRFTGFPDTDEVAIQFLTDETSRTPLQTHTGSVAEFQEKSFELPDKQIIGFVYVRVINRTQNKVLSTKVLLRK
ncbi:hypothetical protein GCM10027190_37520 [Spirosoma areae]